jgi:hypothetical protein
MRDKSLLHRPRRTARYSRRDCPWVLCRQGNNLASRYYPTRNCSRTRQPSALQCTPERSDTAQAAQKTTRASQSPRLVCFRTAGRIRSVRRGDRDRDSVRGALERAVSEVVCEPLAGHGARARLPRWRGPLPVHRPDGRPRFDHVVDDVNKPGCYYASDPIFDYCF